MKSKPNILFIMTDEQRFDSVGYENREVITPNLDKLKKDSINFKRAYTTNPSCIPARGAIFTGRYPTQCGAIGYMTSLNDDETTFMKLLKEGGYYTGVIGKQHFFDTKIERGYLYEDIIDEHEPPEIISDRLRDDEFGLPAHKTTSDKVSSYVKYLYNAGFRRGDELYRQISDKGIYEFFGKQKYYIDEYIGNRGVEWVKDKSPKDEPWFMTLSFSGPHMPFDGIGLKEEDLYKNTKFSRPKTNIKDLENKPPHYKNIVEKFGKADGKEVFSAEEMQLMKRAYFSNMTLVDRKIGEVIAELKAKNLYDDTLIIFTTDHGDFMGEFGVSTKAQYCSESLMRIPFLLKPPIKNYKGYDENALVSSVEIASTCLTVSNLEIPKNISQRSLTQFYDDKIEKEIWTDLFMEARDIKAIRDDRYKLIYYANRDYGELYDLESDPVEKYNLFNDTGYRDIKDELTKKLLNKIIFLGDNMQDKWHVKAPSI